MIVFAMTVQALWIPQLCFISRIHTHTNTLIHGMQIRIEAKVGYVCICFVITLFSYSKIKGNIMQQKIGCQDAWLPIY